MSDWDAIKKTITKANNCRDKFDDVSHFTVTETGQSFIVMTAEQFTLLTGKSVKFTKVK